MKVKELIELLQKQDPEKDVLMCQYGEYDFATVTSVREQHMRGFFGESDIDVVVIQNERS